MNNEFYLSQLAAIRHIIYGGGRLSPVRGDCYEPLKIHRIVQKAERVCSSAIATVAAEQFQHCEIPPARNASFSAKNDTLSIQSKNEVYNRSLSRYDSQKRKAYIESLCC